MEVQKTALAVQGQSNGPLQASIEVLSVAAECLSGGAQERGRTFFALSMESNEFNALQFHVLTELKGMFLHMIDGCRSRKEKT